VPHSSTPVYCLPHRPQRCSFSPSMGLVAFSRKRTTLVADDCTRAQTDGRDSSPEHHDSRVSPAPVFDEELSSFLDHKLATKKVIDVL
jgi:hypothetical protein